MRSILLLLPAILVAGCATQRQTAVQSPPAPVVAAVSPTKLVETRYDVRSYRDAANPAIRHEAHAVYRSTRVPDNTDGNLETAPRTTFAPASLAPLPAGEELAAELASQKAVTAELRRMQASMAETERRMQAQYGQLVRQSSEAARIREQLEGDSNGQHVASAPVPAAPTTEKSSEVKW